MIIRILLINGLKGQQWLAQGSALGIGMGNKRPARAKESSQKSFFCPYRASAAPPVYPGRCPGLTTHCPFGALSGDCR